MARIKYMGSADRRVFKAGEDFQGRLAEPLKRDVVLDWSNRHVIDTEHEDHADLPKAFWTQLAAEPGFADITDMETVPLNDAERLWKGMRDPHDTRWARQHTEVLQGSEVGEQELDNGETVQYNDKFPTRLSPPADLDVLHQTRPPGVVPNDDLDEDETEAVAEPTSRESSGWGGSANPTEDDDATDDDE